MTSGIFTDIPASVYHALPGLSSHVAQLILFRSPRHAWLAHPALNPDYRPDEARPTREQEIGTVAHKLFLGRGREIGVISAPDYRTKAAQELRAQAYAAGHAPILEGDFAIAEAMAKVLPDHDDGDTEVVLRWDDDGVECRAMLDFLSADRLTIMEYKTVPSAAPGDVARHLAGMRYYFQVSFYLRGLDALDEDGRGRRSHQLIVQEREGEFAWSMPYFSAGALELGRRQVEAAVELWGQCLKADRWPSYSPAPYAVDVPAYQETAWMERELAGDDGQGAILGREMSR